MTMRRSADPTLFWLSLIATVMGLIFIFDAGYARSLSSNGRVLPPEFTSQLMYCAVAFGAYALVSRLPAKFFQWVATPYYVACIGLLLLVEAIGVEQNGSKLWLAVGPITVQPSELAKLGMILFLAKAFMDRPRFKATGNVRDFVSWLVHVGWPYVRRLGPGFGALALVGLVEFGSDLGTAAVLLGIAGILFMAGGVSARTLLTAGAVIGAAVVFLAVRQPYRLARIQNHWTRWSPENVDAIGFQSTQAERAVADGGWLGVGIGNGQVKHIIPAPTTDFIMATIGEETGFWGAFAVILIIFAIVFRLLWLARRRTDRFGSLVLIGTAGWIGIQGCTNFMMANGSLPAIGIPVPFISSGGSSLVSMWMAIAVCQAVLVPKALPQTAPEEAANETSHHGWRNRRTRLSGA